MKSKSQKIHFALLVSAVALTNCANPRMMQVPPAPVVEIIPVNNNAGYLWIPGRYRYQRGAYVWHQVAISTCLEGGAVGCKESTSWYVADIDTGMDTGNSRN